MNESYMSNANNYTYVSNFSSSSKQNIPEGYKKPKNKVAVKKVEIKYITEEHEPTIQVAKGEEALVYLKLKNNNSIPWPEKLEMVAGFFNTEKTVKAINKNVAPSDTVDLSFNFGPWNEEGNKNCHLQFNWVCQETKTKYFSKKIHIAINVKSNEGKFYTFSQKHR